MTVKVVLNDDEKSIYFQTFKFQENSRMVVKHHSFIGEILKDGATIDLTGHDSSKYINIEVNLEEEKPGD